MKRKLFNKKFSFRSFVRNTNEFHNINHFSYFEIRFIHIHTDRRQINLLQLIDFSYDLFLLHVV